MLTRSLTLASRNRCHGQEPRRACRGRAFGLYEEWLATVLTMISAVVDATDRIDRDEGTYVDLPAARFDMFPGLVEALREELASG
jgi:hypothetical protein